MGKSGHPLVTKEIDRLKFVTRQEKLKPENRGRNVFYDHINRFVKVDGRIIDSFRIQFFH